MKPRYLIFLITLLFSHSSFAQTTALTPDTVPETLQLAGRGIQNESTGEIIFLACTDSQNQCHRLRIVQVKDQKTPVWLGSGFPSENTIQVREDLRKWYKEQRIDSIFLFLANPNYTYAFTEKNGWNWSNSPLKLAKKDFMQISSTLIYYATYQRAAESEKSMVTTAVPDADRADRARFLSPPTQQVQQITEPALNKIRFSSDSNANGVCRALGYDHAADGSVKKSGEAIGATIVANRDGKIFGGSRVTDKEGYFISQILCLNPVSTAYQADLPELVQEPKLNHLYFSNQSDQNGICRALGYERAAKGSMKKSGEVVGLTVEVNSDGIVSGGNEVTAREGYWASELVCVNPQSAKPNQETPVKIDHPTLDGIYFSDSSNSDGVCRALHYDRAADGGRKKSGEAVGSVIAVDRTGKITGGGIVTDKTGFWILEIICIQKY
jgi:hypothetical protein